MLLAVMTGFSQGTENVTVSGAIVTPDPTTLGFAQQQTCFNYSATNGASLEQTGEEIVFTVTFFEISAESVAAAMITSPDEITWTFDDTASEPTWVGVIDTDLGIFASGLICFDGLEVDGEATIEEVTAGTGGVGATIQADPHSEDTAPSDDFTSDFTFTTGVLPIELGDFSAEAVGADGELTWTTLTEINNSHFEIERTVDGFNWEYVNTVESKAITGNSEVELTYGYTDKSAASFGSEIFYRLKQVDLGVDASFSYTPIRLVTFDENLNLETLLFPSTVVNGSPVNVQGNDIQSIEVFTMSGELVNVIQENGVRSTSIDTSDLAKGLYIVVVNNNQKLKFVVQ